MRALAIPLVTFAIATAPAAERVPAPEPLPADAHVLAYAVIPSLTGLLTHAEAAAKNFTQLPDGMLAMQAGGVLGDPGLANLDASRPILVLVTSTDTPGGAPDVSVWVPAKDPAKYVATAANWRRAGEAVGTLAVLGQNADAVKRATAFAGVYDGIAKPATDLRLRVAGDRLIAAYDTVLADAIDGFASRFAALPRQPGQMDPGPLLRFEMQTLQAMAHDIRDVQIDLTVGADTVDAVTTVTAVPDSAFAAALVAPSGAGARAAAALGPGEGVMTMVGAYDARALTKYLAGVLRAPTGAGGAPVVDESITRLIENAGEAFTGELATRMTVDADGKPGTATVMGVASADKARALLRDAAALTAPDGAIGKLYASLGFPMSLTYEPEVRRSGDLAVGRASMQLDAAKLPAEQQRMFAAMVRPWELAIGPNWMFGGQTAAELDRLIARAAEASPAGTATTKAEQILGAGRDLYIDYDVIGAMRMSFSSFATGPMADAMKPMIEALAALPPEQPLVAASTSDHGAFRAEYRLPLKSFADLTKAMQKAGQGQRQRRQRPGPGQNGAPGQGQGGDPAPAKSEF